MNEYLNDALNGISDEKIEEAVNRKKTKRLTFLKTASAACVVIAVTAAIVLAVTGGPKPDDQTQCQVDAVTSAAAANIGGGEMVPGGAEIYQEKKWNEKESNEKYTELSFNGQTYLSTGMTAEMTDVGAKHGSAKAKGFDSYTDKVYETDCEVYSVGSFNSEFLVAVKFGSDDNYYAYKIEDWFPSDLKDFTDKLNFSENIKIDSDIILSSDFDVSASKIKLHDNEALFKAVYSLLENNGDAKALEYTSDNMPVNSERILEFGVSSPLLSRYSLFLSVSEDGYIMTNLVDVGVSFFVGREAVKALFETADKIGGVKYVPTTTPPSPTENEVSEVSTVYRTTFWVSQSTDEYAQGDVNGIDTIEVTEVYSEASKEE